MIYEGEKPGTLSAIEREDVSNGRKVKLKGNGDFRSDECIKFLKEADIVVTNPPFSLFREYVAQLMTYGKKFVIIGNQNALTYKEIFPLIKDNKIRCGYISGSRTFLAPDDYPGNCFEKDGRKWVTMGNTCWFTNLDLAKSHEPLSLTEEYALHPERYPKYDNYDAIEVPKVSLIPKDYFGVMGVPITFFDKYCSEQFELLGATQRGCHDDFPDTKKYDDYWEVRQNGERTGSSGGKTNENANLRGNDGKKNYFINAQGETIQSAYQRLFIRRQRT